MLESGAISEIALIFVTSDDFDAQLNRALAIAGEKIGVSRSYVFLDSTDGATTSETHEWCARGIESKIAHHQNIPCSRISPLRSLLENKPAYAVDDVRTLPSDIRNILEAPGVRSVLIAPLRAAEGLRGYLGFDECSRVRTWSEMEIETLRTIEGIISTAYSKQLLTRRISASEDNFRNFFSAVDDIILVGDLSGRIIFANEGAVRKLGYSLEEFLEKNILDLHPPDKRDEAGRILEAMFHKELDRCPLELWTRDREGIPVETRIWFGQWGGQDCIFGVSKDLSAEQAALQKFEMLFRSNPAPMAVSRIEDGYFIDVNDAFCDTFGYKQEEVIGHSSLELGLFAEDTIRTSAREDILKTGYIRNRELFFRHKDGGLIHGLLSGDMLESQGQKFFLSIMIDITEQVRLRAELEAEHARLANTIEGTRLGTWEWNVQTGETIFNDRWAEIIGYTLEELMPTTINTWQGFAHPDALAESTRLINLHFDGTTEYYEFESRMRHKNGSWIWVLDRGKVIERGSDGRPLKMYGTHSDITEKKLLEEQVRDLAIRDPLTQAYNRRYIYDRLSDISAEYSRWGRTFCISILDIDHFKTVNDTYGHQAGDSVLREFTVIVSSTIRQYDLLGRYGGEEFIIVSTSARGPETAAMIGRIMDMVRKRVFLFEDHEIRLTFSGGLADSSEFARDEFSVETMIALADKRLYQAKEGGRNRFIVN